MKRLSLLLSWFVTAFTSELEYEVDKISMFTKVHILRIDPKKYEIRIGRAEMEDGKARQHVKDIVYNRDALAGVNGGFWKDNGDPAGILKVAGQWIAQPKKARGAIGWSNDDGSAIIDQLLTEEVDGEIVVKPQSDPSYTSEEDWANLENIIGGTPVLVRNGEIVDDYTIENITIETFITKRHFRTAIGILEDGTWVIIVASGPVVYTSGFTIPELAAYMKQLGCKEAFNLDGGWSSSMVIGDQSVNTNYGRKKVSESILIYSR